MRTQQPLARCDRDGHVEQRREILTHVELAVLAADEHRDLPAALRRFGLCDGGFFGARQTRCILLRIGGSGRRIGHGLNGLLGGLGRFLGGLWCFLSPGCFGSLGCFHSLGRFRSLCGFRSLGLFDLHRFRRGRIDLGRLSLERPGVDVVRFDLVRLHLSRFGFNRSLIRFGLNRCLGRLVVGLHAFVGGDFSPGFGRCDFRRLVVGGSGLGFGFRARDSGFNGSRHLACGGRGVGHRDDGICRLHHAAGICGLGRVTDGRSQFQVRFG